MADTEPLATTKNVLHPRQVAEIRETAAQQKAMLNAPPHIRNQIQDPQALANSIRHLEGVLASEAAQPIPAERMDEAVKMEAALRAAWLDGMPTQAEMRRNPPGAVDKNRSWDKKHKVEVLTWKHLRRRLHASGVSDFGLDDESDVSNIEKFRPRGGSGELNLAPAQIEGNTMALPPAGAEPAAVFSDHDIALLKSIDPDIAASVGLLPNAARRRILDILRASSAPAGNTADRSAPDEGFGLGEPSAVSPQPSAKAKTAPSMKELRAEAKALGINSFGMGKAQLAEAIAAKPSNQP